MGDFDPRKLLEKRFTLFARIYPPDTNSQKFIQLLSEFPDDVTVVDYDQLSRPVKRQYFPWLVGFPMLAEWKKKQFYQGLNAYNVILNFAREQKEVKDGAFSSDVDHAAQHGISLDEWALPFSSQPMEHVLGQTFDSAFSVETDEQRLARKIPKGKRGGNAFQQLAGEYQQQRAQHDAILARRMGQPVSAAVNEADVQRQVEAIQRKAIASDGDVPPLIQQTFTGGNNRVNSRGVPVNSEGARRGEALLQAQRDLVKGAAAI